MPRRGGTWIGWPLTGLACLLGLTTATGTLDDLIRAAFQSAPAHGAKHVIQDHVPHLPAATPPQGSGGPYRPNVCHPNTEQPASREQLNAWITQAGKLLHRRYSAAERADVLLIIDRESFGRVHAINCWDRNWRDGHPSMGLIQAIDTTYMAHAPKSCRRLALIYNPPCNIAAGTHYAISRYGSLTNVPGVRGVRGGGKYSGY